MNDRYRFTEEELALAKTAELTAVASALGYTVRRVGKYHTLKEMDSIRIYNAATGSVGPDDMRERTMVVPRLIFYGCLEG